MSTHQFNNVQQTDGGFYRMETIDRNLNGYIEFNGKIQMIKDKYRIEKQAAHGTYGPIYFGRHVSKEYSVVIKFFSNTKENEQKKKFFDIEEHILKLIKQLNLKGFPTMVAHGYHHDMEMNYIATNKYDVDLETLFQKLNKNLRKSTIIAIGIQLIERLEKLHGLGFLHNDVKPQNILVNKCLNYITLCDFTMASPISENHLKEESNMFKGIPTFISTGILEGNGASMKDDLESIGYILIYLLQGTLPWQKHKRQVSTVQIRKITDEDTDLNRLILLRHPNTLCMNFDSEITQYLIYCQNIPRSKRPDYRYLKGLLQDIRKRDDCTENLEWYEYFTQEQNVSKAQALQITNARNKITTAEGSKISSTDLNKLGQNLNTKLQVQQNQNLRNSANQAQRDRRSSVMPNTRPQLNLLADFQQGENKSAEKDAKNPENNNKKVKKRIIIKKRRTIRVKKVSSNMAGIQQQKDNQDLQIPMQNDALGNESLDDQEERISDEEEKIEDNVDRIEPQANQQKHQVEIEFEEVDDNVGDEEDGELQDTQGNEICQPQPIFSSYEFKTHSNYIKQIQ